MSAPPSPRTSRSDTDITMAQVNKSVVHSFSLRFYSRAPISVVKCKLFHRSKLDSISMLILNGISAGRYRNCLLACRPIGMIEIPAGRGRHFHFSVGEILILISTGRI